MPLVRAGTALARTSAPLLLRGTARLGLLRCASSAAPASTLASKVLDSVGVKSGDVLVQNEADGETGRAVIEAAKGRGVRTVNVIADKPGAADIIERLKHAGADVVVTESYCNTWYVRRLLSDLPTPAVGLLNAADGSHATVVAKLLGKGSKLVTYGGSNLPRDVAYPGAERKPKKWSEYLKEKGVTAKALSLN